MEDIYNGGGIGLGTNALWTTMKYVIFNKVTEKRMSQKLSINV